MGIIRQTLDIKKIIKKYTTFNSFFSDEMYGMFYMLVEDELFIAV